MIRPSVRTPSTSSTNISMAAMLAGMSFGMNGLMALTRFHVRILDGSCPLESAAASAPMRSVISSKPIGSVVAVDHRQFANLAIAHEGDRFERIRASWRIVSGDFVITAETGPSKHASARRSKSRAKSLSVKSPAETAIAIDQHHGAGSPAAVGEPSRRPPAPSPRRGRFATRRPAHVIVDLRQLEAEAAGRMKASEFGIREFAAIARRRARDRPTWPPRR